ncbi:MAG: hypothetical protein K2X81_08170 [Candidatus Obscuribacterales bacterium]|nr:hypothetical protein [Candidatus Obscuribacterales bacterium]
MEANEIFERIHKEYLDLVQKASSLCFMSCKTSLQADCAAEIMKFIQTACVIEKKGFVSEQRHDLAENVIVLQAQLSALVHELGCLVCLKEELAESAWDHLILAENAVKVVARLHGGAENQFERLRHLQSIFFPAQTFMSAGIVIKKATCSICSSNYENCSHILGKIYDGELCHRIVEEVDLKEVSVLLEEEPYDRRCRITHLSKAGIKTNLMTLETEPCEPSDGITISGYSIKY